ncbi:hypothetical protein [Rhodococcus sp. NPDC058521]|uniref:hypothetical protein n=1 Tax=Rhodococcus sp. NPDC058521 TaxID=3346536 RepID=UPI00365D10C0
MRAIAATAVMTISLMMDGTALAHASPPSQPPSALCVIVGGPIYFLQQQVGLDPYGLSQDPLAVALRNLQMQVCSQR